jgi:23S rRNA (cytidine1920-2'-O)/16S rRNA (cytidine1409-2'-O)-methyltransferase
MGRTSPRLRALAIELARRYPHLDDPDDRIAAGHVMVNGFPQTNPTSLVDPQDSIVVRQPKRLRGTAKLSHALHVFGVSPRGRVALDLGAAAGGFTQALLDGGATRVYAVDVGYGQLLGSLRQDPRVVNLERTNLADLDESRVPDVIGLISLDLSYLSIASAVLQLQGVKLEPAAHLIALVKPAYELGLPSPPSDERVVATAVRHAIDGLSATNWRTLTTERSPVLGSRGAIEYLVHAIRDAE